MSQDTAPTFDGEQVVINITESEKKCPMCNFRGISFYRLESEDPDVEVCGDCFSTWLIEEDAEVTIR